MSAPVEIPLRDTDEVKDYCNFYELSAKIEKINFQCQNLPASKLFNLNVDI